MQVLCTVSTRKTERTSGQTPDFCCIQMASLYQEESTGLETDPGEEQFTKQNGGCGTGVLDAEMVDVSLTLCSHL